MPEEAFGRIVAIARKPGRGEPMAPVERTHLTEDGTLAESARSHPRRGVTLLSEERWAEVAGELGVPLPWHTRRANVLVAGLELGELIGSRVRIGAAELDILGETEPCQNMDRQHPGLRAALVPDCRGGVHGRVLAAGDIAVGDRVVVVAERP